MTYEDFLNLFPGKRIPNGDGGFRVSCPVPGHGKGRGDVNPSLSISPGNGSGPLLHCFADCETKDILAAVGQGFPDILPPRDEPRRRKTDARNPAPANVAEVVAIATKPISVAELAKDKGLPVEFVQSLGIKDRHDGVLIPYRMMDGTPAIRRRLRTALSAKEGSIWLKPKNISPVPYGLDRLAEAREQGFIVFVEGESDCWTLWHHGIPALGIPGADMAGKIEAEHLAGIPEVYYWREPDKSGVTFAAGILKRLREIGYTGQIREMKLEGVKDPNDLHKQNPETFKARFQEAIAFAVFPAKGPATETVTKGSPAVSTTVDKPSIGPKAPLFASLASLLAKPRPQRWLVERLIEAPSTVMVFGPSGSGKSFIAVDLAGATATGGEWCGRQVSAGAVYYLLGEGRNGTLRRFKAWQLKRKMQIPEDRLFLSIVSIELNASGAAEVQNEVERRAEKTGEAPALIIVDTLSRMMPAGDDENSVKDMMAFVKAVDQIRDRFDCVAVIVHHAGMADDKRARGSTSLKAAMDAELCITKRGAIRIAEWTKLKDLPDELHPQEFVLEPELLDRDEDGNLITSAVVEWKGRTTVKTTTITKAESLGLETLRAAIAAAGGPVAVEPWRFIFYSRHWGEDNEAKRKAFRRVRESMAGKGIIAIENGQYDIPTHRDSGT